MSTGMAMSEVLKVGGFLLGANVMSAVLDVLGAGRMRGLFDQLVSLGTMGYILHLGWRYKGDILRLVGM